MAKRALPPTPDVKPVSLTPDPRSQRKDVVTIRLWCDEPRWCSEVTLGPMSHDLGTYTTSSMAMNAAMKFYYEQRPTARKRGRPRG